VISLFFSAAVLHFYVSIRIKTGVDGVQKTYSKSFVYSAYLLSLFFIQNATIVPFITIFKNAMTDIQVVLMLFLYLLYLLTFLVTLFKTAPIAFSELYRTKRTFAGWSWFISVIFVALVYKIIISVLRIDLVYG